MIGRALKSRPSFFAGVGALSALLATQFGAAPRVGIPSAEREIPAVRIGDQKSFAMDEIARFPTPGEVRQITFNGDLAYASMAFGGLATLDAADPAAPRLLHHIAGMRDEHDAGGHVVLSTLLIDGGARLLVCDRRRGLGVYDLAQPDRPALAWTLELPGGVNDRAVSATRVGDQYFLACGSAGLRSVPADFAGGSPAPALLRNVDYTRQSVSYPPHWLLVSDTYGTGMRVMDIKDPAHPKLVHSFQTGTYCDDIIPLGRYVVLGVRARGLMIVDMNDPANPVLENTTTDITRAEVHSIALWRDHYLIASHRAGFVDLFDMADPTRPVVLARIKTPFPVAGLTVRGDILYAGYWGRPELGVFRLSEVKPASE